MGERTDVRFTVFGATKTASFRTRGRAESFARRIRNNGGNAELLTTLKIQTRYPYKK